MKRTSAAATLVGLLILTALIAYAGLQPLSEVLASIGWRMLWLPLLFIPALLFAGLSWQQLYDTKRRLPLAVAIHGSWITLGINWLMPVAQIGGEVVRLRLLHQHGEDLPLSAATVLGDKTMQVFAQVLFAAAAVAALIIWQGNTGGFVWGGSLGVLCLWIGIYGFWRVQKAGLFQLIAKPLHRLLAARGGEDSQCFMQAADQELLQMYRRWPQLFWSCLHRSLFRLFLILEGWLVFQFLGLPIGLIEIFIIESLGQAIRAAAFVIPGGLGAQESGYALLVTIFGFSPEIGLALSLCKRSREVLIGLPAILAWQLQESRKLIKGDSVANTSS